MSIDWDEYERFDPWITGPYNALPRSEARRAFNRCMETKGDRIEMLRRLLSANGVELGGDDSSIQDLNDWFYANVEPDPEKAGNLRPGWYSVAHDIALFLGEVMIERHPHLRWVFFIWGKTDVSYQRHVIMGLSTEDPKFHTNIDIEDMVMAYAHQIIEHRGSIPKYGSINIRGVEVDVDAVAAQHRGRAVETDAFWRWLQMVARRA